MKFKPIQILLPLILVTIAAPAQEKSDAGSYLTYIGEQYQELTESMLSYTSAVAHGKSARKVEKRRAELLQQVKESERNVRRMKPFQNDSNLRDSVVAYFNLCFHVLNEDYEKILNMEDIAEQSYDLMEAYLLAKEKANEKLDDAGGRVDVVFNAFVAGNGIKIIDSESKIEQKMKIAARVTSYYNQLYLIFFKSYKDEGYFLQALSKRDFGAMEQSISALKSSADAGLTKINSMSSFNGDGSLKVSCQQLLKFFKRETTVHFPSFVEFEIRKENLEKMQKAFNGKKPEQRTQKEADAMSMAVKEYNVWVNKINSLNEESNKNRSNLITQWNNRCTEFLDRHTPKHR